MMRALAWAVVSGITMGTAPFMGPLFHEGAHCATSWIVTPHSEPCPITLNRPDGRPGNYAAYVILPDHDPMPDFWREVIGYSAEALYYVVAVVVPASLGLSSAWRQKWQSSA